MQAKIIYETGDQRNASMQGLYLPLSQKLAVMKAFVSNSSTSMVF